MPDTVVEPNRHVLNKAMFLLLWMWRCSEGKQLTHQQAHTNHVKWWSVKRRKPNWVNGIKSDESIVLIKYGWNWTLTKIRFQQDPERSKVVGVMAIWGKSILGREKRKYTAPEVCMAGLLESTASFNLQRHRLWGQWQNTLDKRCQIGRIFFFPFIFISWRLITLQYCSGFCHTLTWISHGFTCVPHPDPPSQFEGSWNAEEMEHVE